MDLRPLKDEALLARLDALACQERESAADIVEHLVEVDRRELAIDRGYSTLFDYCVRRLRYSEAAAFLRIRAARAAATFPRVLTDLRSGAIHLDTIMRLYPHLNARNCDELLGSAAGKSKREVMMLTAGLGGTDQPAPERDVIRPLAASGMVSARDGAAVPDGSESGPATSPVVAEVVAPPSRIRIAFTADDRFLVMVERLRALLRHKHPSGRLEDVLAEAVATLLKKIDPDLRSSARRVSKRPSVRVSTNGRSRHIPAAIRKEVWQRDGGRCAYVAADGLRCQAREFLEYDHIVPYSLGGRSDHAGNIRLLCRAHNQRLARRRLGPRRSAGGENLSRRLGESKSRSSDGPWRLQPSDGPQGAGSFPGLVERDSEASAGLQPPQPLRHPQDENLSS